MTRTKLLCEATDMPKPRRARYFTVLYINDRGELVTVEHAWWGPQGTLMQRQDGRWVGVDLEAVKVAYAKVEQLKYYYPH